MTKAFKMAKKETIGKMKMIYTDFNMKEHGFVGHMAEPEGRFTQAVIVIMCPLKVRSIKRE